MQQGSARAESKTGRKLQERIEKLKANAFKAAPWNACTTKQLTYTAVGVGANLHKFRCRNVGSIAASLIRLPLLQNIDPLSVDNVKKSKSCALRLNLALLPLLHSRGVYVKERREHPLTYSHLVSDPLYLLRA